MELFVSVGLALTLTIIVYLIRSEFSVRRQVKKYGLPVTYLMRESEVYEGFKPLSKVRYDISDSNRIIGQIIGTLSSEKMVTFLAAFENYEIHLLFRKEVSCNSNDRYLAFVVNEIITFARIPAGQDLIILDET